MRNLHQKGTIIHKAYKRRNTKTPKYHQTIKKLKGVKPTITEIISMNRAVYTKGLTSGDNKVVGKEYSMIFAIKNDFIDDFLNLFIFFEYNIEAKICILKICKGNNNNFTKYSIIDWIYKYDAFRIYEYLSENDFIKSICTNSLIIMINNYSIMCFKDTFESYDFDRGMYRVILGSLIANRKLSLNSKKYLIKKIAKTDNKKMLYQLTTENKNIVCLAMENKQYELAIWLMQNYGCLLLHGSFHLKQLQSGSQCNESEGFYEQIKPYKDELYLCREIMYLMLQGHKYDENSTIFHDKFPLDIIKYILGLFYEDRINEIYYIKELQYLE